MKEAEEIPAINDLISLCCAAELSELRRQLALPQFQQLLCKPLQFRNFQNETILHYMCAYTFEELAVVQELLNNGASACINMGPVPPLAYAVQRNHKEVVRLLLTHGAQPEPAMAYAVSSEILKILKKQVRDNREDPPAKAKDAPAKAKDAPEKKQTDNQINKVSLAIAKHISTLFSYVELSDVQKVSNHLAKVTSFSSIVLAYQTLYDLCKPEGEKATAEFVVSALLLPWGLPPFARHIAVDRQGQSNRIAEAMFKNVPAYQIAVFVESKLASFEKERPWSSFPHLYITLVHAIADAIITSLIGNYSQSSSDTMAHSTSKLLKWISAVGFASLNSVPEPSSLLKNRLYTNSLYLASRHLATTNHQDTPSPSSLPSSSPNSSPTISPSPTLVSPPLAISEDYPPSFPVLSTTSAQFARSNSPQSFPTVIFSPPTTSSPLSQGEITSPSQTTSTTQTGPVISPSVTHTPYSAPRPSTPPQSIPSYLPRSTSPPNFSSPIVITTPVVLPISPHTTTPIVPITVAPPTILPIVHPVMVTLQQSLVPVDTHTIPTTPTTPTSQHLVTIRLDHPDLGDINLKMYNTTALSVLHDKLSTRLKSRLTAQIATVGRGENLEPLGKLNEFVFKNSIDGRQIVENEPGVIGDLEHPSNFIILCVVNR